MILVSLLIAFAFNYFTMFILDAPSMYDECHCHESVHPNKFDLI